MHGFTIDLLAAVSAVESGVGLNKPVGGAKDNYGTYYAVFIRTYPPDHEFAGAPVRYENGRIAFNLRKSLRQGG